MDPARIRNFGVVAHVDAGKTTVSEQLLFDAGVQHKFGSVDAGDTVLDWMVEERERGITITAAAITLPWRGCQLNLIDTPGHVDFTVEVERAMRVLDGAVLVLDAVQGVQAQTETVWRQMRRHRVSAIAFVNKLDRVGADALAAADDFSHRLDAPARPVQFPLVEGEGGGHPRPVALIDLITLETWRFADGHATHAAESIPDAVADDVGVLRAELVDDLLGPDADEDAPDLVERLRAAIRARVRDATFVPVFCGAALRQFGIRPLLDAVVDYLPAPIDLPPIHGRDPRTGTIVERERLPSAPTAALAFKLQALEHGDILFARVYSGAIEAGGGLYNPRLGRHERIHRVLRMRADRGENLDVAQAGDIVALVGPKLTVTGDTLCTQDAPLVLESMTIPEPVLTRWVEPRSSADRDRLGAALERMAREDPSLVVTEDPDAGRWLLAGMGELHLEIAQHRLEHAFHAPCNLGEPRVAFRETARGPGEAAATVERTIAGRKVFGEVRLAVAPEPDAERPRIEWDAGEAIPAAFRPAVTESLEAAATSGPGRGLPLTGVRITVVGGRSEAAHDHDAAFAEAAALALGRALQAAGLDVLEPWVQVDVEVREEFAHGIVGDLTAHGADLNDVASDGDLRRVRAAMPLAAALGYPTRVRSLSQGTAVAALTPSGYRPVPAGELAARGLD